MIDLLKAKLDPFTLWWVWITFAGLLVSILFVWWWKKKNTLSAQPRFVTQLPSLLSTFGVLGTFVGITNGLIHFDTNDIDSSIPFLLDGLKTAFYTSLAGMVSSMILQWFITRWFDEVEKVSDITKASKDIVEAVNGLKNVLETQTSNQKENFTDFYNNNVKKQFDTFTSLLDILVKNTNSIDGHINSTSQSVKDLKKVSETLISISNAQEVVISEIKNVNSIISDKSYVLESQIAKCTEQFSTNINSLNKSLQDEMSGIVTKMSDTNSLLADKFDEFSELLQKSNTEALVEVMRKVTEEFQKQMNELIGRLVKENFQQLNDSVKRLNDWQLENKEMIQELTSKYVQMTDSFERTSSTLAKVGKDTTALVSDGSKLDQIIRALKEVMIDDEHFVEMGVNLTQSAESVKDANASFNDSAQKLSNWLLKQKDFNENVNVLIKKLDEINKINDYASTFWAQTKKGMNDGIGIIQNGSKNLQLQIDNINQAFYDRLNVILGDLDGLIVSWMKK